MTRAVRFLSLPALFLVAALLLASCGRGEERGPVVLAAASLQNALEEVADAWTAQGRARPVLSFAGTSSLARQVEAGAPADIFFSADEEWMSWLEQRQLIAPGSRRDLLTNRLVLVGGGYSPGLWLPPQPLADVVQEARIAIADPDSVPAGRYARAALEELGAWESVRGRVIPAENVRAALALVKRGEVPFGITYATDQIASEEVGLVGSFPADATPPILYPAALIAGGSHPEAAAFLDFLGSEDALTIFRRHGFGIAL